MVKEDEGVTHDEVLWQRECVSLEDTRLPKAFDISIRKGQKISYSGICGIL